MSKFDTWEAMNEIDRQLCGLEEISTLLDIAVGDGCEKDNEHEKLKRFNSVSCARELHKRLIAELQEYVGNAFEKMREEDDNARQCYDELDALLKKNIAEQERILRCIRGRVA